MNLQALLGRLSKRHLPYTLEDIQAIVRTWGALEHRPNTAYQALLRAFSYPGRPCIFAACRADLETSAETARKWYSDREPIYARFSSCSIIFLTARGRPPRTSTPMRGGIELLCFSRRNGTRPSRTLAARC